MEIVGGAEALDTDGSMSVADLGAFDVTLPVSPGSPTPVSS